MADLGKAYVQIIPSAQGIGSKIKNAIGSDVEQAGDEAGKSFSSRFASTAKLAGGAIGALAVSAGSATVAIGKSAFEAFSSYEQLAGGIQKLYGDASDEMLRYAEQGYLTSGKSANEYMETATQFSAAMIKSLGGNTSEAAKLTDTAMRLISDNVNTFGSDVSSVESAISGLSRQNYTMLDNLKLGYAGTAQGMLELINDSGVLGRTLTDTSELADVGFDKMVLAIQAVQEQQGIAGATAKEAMKTLEGSATATKSAWKNVITAIGRGEGVGEASAGLIKAIFGEGEGEGLINQIVSRVKPILEGVGSFMVEAAPMLIEALGSLVEVIGTSLPETILTLMPVLASTASSVIQSLFGFFMENLPALMDAGTQMLHSLVDGIVTSLPEIISTGISMLTQFLSTIVAYLPELLGMGLQLVGSLIEGLIEAIPDLLDGCGEILDSAWEAFTSFDWLGLGMDIVNGIIDGIWSVGGKIGDTLKDLAKGAWNGLKDFFGIASPSKLMRDSIGRYIPEGLAVGIEANADSVYDAMDSMSRMTVDAYDPDFSSTSSSSGMSTAIIDELRSLKAAITGMQIVLDTGATVGGLAPAMDTQLGAFSTYKGRGN